MKTLEDFIKVEANKAQADQLEQYLREKYGLSWLVNHGVAKLAGVQVMKFLDVEPGEHFIEALYRAFETVWRACLDSQEETDAN